VRIPALTTALPKAAPLAASAPAAAPKKASAKEVEPTRTKATVGELRGAIARACEKLHGSAPKELVDTLTAQASLETGRGQHMYNWNFGGIKGSGPTGLTAKCHTKEVIDGKQVEIVDGFRAYGSLDEGALDYVATLRGRFGRSWDAAQTGDVRGFAHALKAQGYYTASEVDYTKALTSLYTEAAGAPPMPAPTGVYEPRALEPPPLNLPDSALVGRLDALVGQAMTRILAPVDG